MRWRGVSDRSTFSLCHWRWERATLTEERLHPGDRGEGRRGEDGGGGGSRTDGEGEGVEGKGNGWEGGRGEGREREDGRKDGRRERMKNKAREREEAHRSPWPVFSSPPVASVSDSGAVLPPVVCMMSIGDSCRSWPEQTCT